MVLPDGERDGWGYGGGITNIKRVIRKFGFYSMKESRAGFWRLCHIPINLFAEFLYGDGGNWGDLYTKYQ